MCKRAVNCSVVSPLDRNLEVDDEMQSKKQCISESDEQLLDENDQILWCELLDRGESVIEEWNGVDDDHQDVATEQLGSGSCHKRK